MKKCPMVFLFVFIAAGAFASGGRELIGEGNTAYAAQQYEQALKHYQEYETSQPESAEAAFNKGASYFRLQDYEQAREAFQAAALRTDDLKLEAGANFNLGNTAFMQAGRAGEGDLEKAVELYTESINFYKHALELDPQQEAAAYNIEVTRLILKDMLDKLKEQQKNQQEQQEKIKKILEQLVKLIQEEETIIDHSGSLNAEKIAQGVSASLRSSAAQLRSRQNANRSGTYQVAADLQALMDESQQGQAGGQPAQASGQPGAQPAQAQLPPDNPLVVARTHVERAANFQELAENNLGTVKLEEAVKAEEDARDELVKAVEALSEPQDQNQEQQPQDSEDEQQQEQQQQQQAAADDILDQEKENQEQRQQQQGGYYAPLKDY